MFGYSLFALSFNVFFSLLFSLTICSLTGHECKSDWNFIEANIIWDKPASISPDMGLHSGGGFFRDYTIELFEQGKLLLSFFLYY